jgi:hypothetical protein
MSETGKRERDDEKTRAKDDGCCMQAPVFILGAVLTPIVPVNADAERSRPPSTSTSVSAYA